MICEKLCASFPLGENVRNCIYFVHEIAKLGLSESDVMIDV